MPAFSAFMQQLVTEARNPASSDIDRLSTLEMLKVINVADQEVARSVEREIAQIALAVDGGITAETAPDVLAAGADTLIAGTAVFAAPDRAAAITALRHGVPDVSVAPDDPASGRVNSSAAAITSALAPPPMSRKFAAVPPT